MRQPYGPGDIIEIDVIDADLGVFGPSAAPPAPVRRPRPRWLVPTAIAVAGVCGAAAMVWRPWEPPPDWRTFGPAAPAVASLSDHLVLDLDGVTVTSLHVGPNSDADDPAPLGHVFAAPGGTYEYDAWALFHSGGSNADGAAPVSKSTDLVRGLPAEVRSVRVRTTVRWGPIGGNYWDSETNRLHDDAALDFANAVGVVAGLPAVAYGHNMGVLKPLGDVKTLARVQVLAAYLDSEPVLSKFTPTVVTYEVGSTPVTVASIDTDTDGLAMARFYLDQGRDVIVHGVPGALIETRRIGKVVVWHEGNRLVVVTADVTDDQLLAMAKAVRPATQAEWDQVIAATAAAPTDPGEDVTPASLTIGAGLTPDSDYWRGSITLGNPTVLCIHDLQATGVSEASCVYTTPLSPSTHVVDHEGIGSTFVSAVVPTGSRVLRITNPAGEFVDFQPIGLDDTTAAVAALLPPGATYDLVEPAVRG